MGQIPKRDPIRKRCVLLDVICSNSSRHFNENTWVDSTDLSSNIFSSFCIKIIKHDYLNVQSGRCKRICFIFHLDFDGVAWEFSFYLYNSLFNGIGHLKMIIFDQVLHHRAHTDAVLLHPG